MEEPRASLWPRLVVFYAHHKPDQLNCEVIAEIIAKYGSRERELSARLMKKYGQALPRSVTAQAVRDVLNEFSMEDRDPEMQTDGYQVGASEASRSGMPHEARTATDPMTLVGAGGRDQRGSQEDREEQAWTEAAKLDFRSPLFDPLKALFADGLQPPIPNAPPLDNLAKFSRLINALAIPRGSPSPVASPADATGASGDIANRRLGPGRDDNSPAPTEGASGTSNSSQRHSDTAALVATRANSKAPGTAGLTESEARIQHSAGSVPGHYIPLRSVGEIERSDVIKAQERQRRAEEAHATKSSSQGQNPDPLASIMERYAGTGPYSLLYRLHDEGRRTSVMIRRLNRLPDMVHALSLLVDSASVRGVCTGLIRAFDKHMNLLLADVTEKYTAFVPAHERRPALPPRPPPDPSLTSTHASDSDTWGSESDQHRTGERFHTRGVLKQSTGDSSATEEEENRKGEQGGSLEEGEIALDECKHQASSLGPAETTSGEGDSAPREGEVTRGADDQPLRTSASEGNNSESELRDGQRNKDSGSSTKGRRSKRSGRRRDRHRGPWRGELKEVTRERFLKQLLIRGDNVVMIWEAPHREIPHRSRKPAQP